MLVHIGQALLLFIPTNVMGLYVAAGIQGKYPPWPTLLIYGSVAGLLTAVFRALPWSFGFHTPLIALTLVIMVRYITRGTWGMAVLGTMICQVAAIIGEGLIGVPVATAMGVTLAESLQSVWLTALGGWLSNIPLLILALGLYLRGRKQPRPTP